MIDWTQRAEYLKWANSRLGTHFDSATATTLTSLAQDGSILCVVIFSRFTRSNCEVTAVGDRGITRSFLKAIFVYAFVQCGLRRMTAFIAVDNEKSLNRAQRLGFRMEGVARDWFPQSDAYLLGLLRDDCLKTWLKDFHGQPLSAAGS
jgi:hypothetical protein